MSLHGDVTGRWFDKSIQLVVAANGVAGICMEHAGFDGTTALRFTDYLVEHEDHAAGGPHDSAQVPAELVFELDDRARTAIDHSSRDAGELARRTDLYDRFVTVPPSFPRVVVVETQPRVIPGPAEGRSPESRGKREVCIWIPDSRFAASSR